MASLDPDHFGRSLSLFDHIRFPRGLRVKHECDVVVAIDFGTSSSGFAFSFNHKDGSEEIYMNRTWGREQGYSTFKTPTCLLLNQQREFKKFGYEAAEKYAELEDAEDRSFYYFDRFKMMLYGSEVSHLKLFPPGVFQLSQNFVARLMLRGLKLDHIKQLLD